LIFQDDRINAMPALHTAQNHWNVLAGVIKVVTPIVHEQAGATGAGSRAELIA
jgi:hypothetical protein